MSVYISVRSVSFTDAAGGVTISVTTDIPCHLWARTSQAEPHIHKIPVLRRGIAFTADVRFCFTAYEDNEQTEPGDTLTHTFFKPWWLFCVTAWVYFWGYVGGQVSVSTSAIFQHHNISTAPPPHVILDVLISSDLIKTTRCLITKTPNGDLYAITSPAPDTVTTLKVYYSSDNGLTWTLSLTITPTNTYHGYVSIAADSTGKVHIVWTERTATYTWKVAYRTGTHGSWATASYIYTSGGHTISGEALWTMCLDINNNPHICLNVWVAGVDHYCVHLWYTGTAWTSERVDTSLMGNFTPCMIVADNLGGLHAVWRYKGLINNVYYSTKPSGGAWSAPINAGLPDEGDFSYIPTMAVHNNGVVHFFGTWQYCQRSVAGVLSPLEAYPNSRAGTSIGCSVDKTGTGWVSGVQIYDGQPNLWLCSRTAAGVWTYVGKLKANWNPAGISFVHALYPAACQLQDGWQMVAGHATVGQYRYLCNFQP